MTDEAVLKWLGFTLADVDLIEESALPAAWHGILRLLVFNSGDRELRVTLQRRKHPEQKILLLNAGARSHVWFESTPMGVPVFAPADAPVVVTVDPADEGAMAWGALCDEIRREDGEHRYHVRVSGRVYALKPGINPWHMLGSTLPDRSER